jgi:hypothetical protein
LKVTAFFSANPNHERGYLQDVRFVTKAENKVPVPILAVILHDVPKDGLMADRYHWFRKALGILTYRVPSSPQNKTTLMAQNPANLATLGRCRYRMHRNVHSADKHTQRSFSRLGEWLIALTCLIGVEDLNLVPPFLRK